MSSLPITNRLVQGKGWEYICSEIVPDGVLVSTSFILVVNLFLSPFP